MKKGSAFIADGLNSFINLKSTSDDLKDIFKIPLMPVRYEKQLKADRCGTSAVMIALEFMRAFKLKKMPEKLEPPRSIIVRVANYFHKHRSATLVKKALYDSGTSVYKCNKCSRSFRKNGARALAMHIARAHK